VASLNLTPTATLGTSTPKRPARLGLAPRNRASFLLVCDSISGDCTNDCTLDDTCGGGIDPTDSSSIDRCTNLYLTIYYATQQWHQDIQARNLLETAYEQMGCPALTLLDNGTAPTLPPTLDPICVTAALTIVAAQISVMNDVGILNNLVYELGVAGCPLPN
jgi:hypothetical protein